MKTIYLFLTLLLFGLTGCVSVIAPLPDDEKAKLADDLRFLTTERVGIYYTVKHGDTLWAIAKKYNVTVEDIERENQDVLKGSRMLKTGQRLFILTEKESIQPIYTAESGFIWPAKGSIIGKSSRSRIKIKAPEGTPVRAVKSGVVNYVDEAYRGFGKIVVINHSDGFTSFYGYNSEILVKAGDQVKQGQIIARVGDTGRAETPQLYFKLLKRGTLVNPVYYLK